MTRKRIACIVSNEAKNTIPGALVRLDEKMQRIPEIARLKITANDSEGSERLSVDIKRDWSDCSCKNIKDFVSCKQNKAATEDAVRAQPISKEISRVLARSSRLSINKGPMARPKNKPPAKSIVKSRSVKQRYFFDQDHLQLQRIVGIEKMECLGLLHTCHRCEIAGKRVHIFRE